MGSKRMMALIVALTLVGLAVVGLSFPRVAMASYTCDDYRYIAQEPVVEEGGCWVLCVDDEGNVVGSVWCRAAYVTTQLLVPDCEGTVDCPVACENTPVYYKTWVYCGCLLSIGCPWPGTHPVFGYIVTDYNHWITCNLCPVHP